MVVSRNQCYYCDGGGGGETIIEIVILLIITLNTQHSSRPLLLDDIDIRVANNTNNKACLYRTNCVPILNLNMFPGEQMYVGNLLPDDHGPADRFAGQIFDIN